MFNRIQKFLTMLENDPDKPKPSNEPEQLPTPCQCGGRRVWFIDPAGEDKPELICVECDRFTTNPGCN